MRANRLLKQGKAAVFRQTPFTIVLKRVVKDVQVPDLRLKNFNRTQRGLPKAHWIDAACVGHSTPEKLETTKIEPLRVKLESSALRESSRSGGPHITNLAAGAVRG